jgi:F-type H+-transporting ATPase subunit epsilon
MTLELEIITPDRTVYNGEIESATFPGSLGTFQVLNSHAPLISTLYKGPMTYVNGEGTHNFKIDGGVVEVLNNKITVLAEAVH